LETQRPSVCTVAQFSSSRLRLEVSQYVVFEGKRSSVCAVA